MTLRHPELTLTNTTRFVFKVETKRFVAGI